MHAQKNVELRMRRKGEPLLRRLAYCPHLDVLHEVTLNVLLELGREEGGLGLLPAQPQFN